MIDVWGNDSPALKNFASERENDAGFDGNRSDALIHWYFPNPEFEGMKDEVLAGFMDMTMRGHLQWAIFPVSA